MDNMRLYGLGRSFESYGTVRPLGCAVLFCFAAAASAGVSAGTSLLHYTPGGFSYEVRLRSYEGSAEQPTSQTNTVTVNVLPPEQPRFIDIKRVADGSCRLLFQGHANTAYRISASTDLITWQDIGVPAQIGSELFAYEDKEAPHFRNRFYRVRVSDTPPPPELTAIERRSDGSFIVRFSGGDYWPHSVWASSDLLEWKLLGAAEEIAPGTFKFTDTNASSISHRFYRASSP